MAAELEAPPCDDLDSWLAAEPVPGERGLHVLCFASPGRVWVFPMGVRSSTPKPINVKPSLQKDIRSFLEQKLRIETTLTYNTVGGVVSWKKQPWTLYTVDGEEFTPGEEAQYIEDYFALPTIQRRTGLTLLLFEGGIWRWPTIEVGYRREVLPGIVLKTMARVPALFEVHFEASSSGGGEDPPELDRQLLSDVVDMASPLLKASQMEGKVDLTIRSSEQTWFEYGSHPKLQQLLRGSMALLKSHAENFEALQVLRYSPHQHYDAHRDYWDPREFPDAQRFTNPEGFWQMRHATLLWYLSSPTAGGETWFPRAGGGPIPWGEWSACDDRGVKVSPANATAVLFYNLRADGDIDEFSWHAGCPVLEGVKWAANSWLRNSPNLPRHRKSRSVSEEFRREL